MMIIVHRLLFVSGIIIGRPSRMNGMNVTKCHCMNSEKEQRLTLYDSVIATGMAVKQVMILRLSCLASLGHISLCKVRVNRKMISLTESGQATVLVPYMIQIHCHHHHRCYVCCDVVRHGLNGLLNGSDFFPNCGVWLRFYGRMQCSSSVGS